MIFQTNASKGMALMNALNGKEWVLDFDLDLFDIAIPSVCVVGQHYDDYDQGLRELFADFGASRIMLAQLSAAYGFDTHIGADRRQLQAEWTALIADQKAELMT